jgi:hypothetical protein
MEILGNIAQDNEEGRFWSLRNRMERYDTPKSGTFTITVGGPKEVRLVDF